MQPTPRKVSRNNAASIDRCRPFFGTHARRDPGHRVSDLVQWFDRMDLTDRTAIDIGCAEGEITHWLGQRFRQVDAMELNAPAVDAATARLAEFANVRVWRADIGELPLRDSYDFVFMLGVLHYIEPPARRLAVARHCLAHARAACVLRTGILEFRQGIPGRENSLHRCISLRDLQQAAEDEFDLYTLDNTPLGQGDLRLGDLAIYIRKNAGLAPPAIDRLKSAPRD